MTLEERVVALEARISYLEGRLASLETYKYYTPAIPTRVFPIGPSPYRDYWWETLPVVTCET
jgi:hypothetical protein